MFVHSCCLFLKIRAVRGTLGSRSCSRSRPASHSQLPRPASHSSNSQLPIQYMTSCFSLSTTHTKQDYRNGLSEKGAKALLCTLTLASTNPPPSLAWMAREDNGNASFLASACLAVCRALYCALQSNHHTAGELCGDSVRAPGL